MKRYKKYMFIILSVLVDGENELYTKNMAKKIAFSLNRAGCMLPGHTFAEATGSLKNQTKNAMHRNLSLKEAFFANVSMTLHKLMFLSFKITCSAKTEL